MLVAHSLNKINKGYEPRFSFHDEALRAEKLQLFADFPEHCGSGCQLHPHQYRQPVSG